MGYNPLPINHLPFLEWNTATFIHTDSLGKILYVFPYLLEPTMKCQNKRKKGLHVYPTNQKS